MALQAAGPISIEDIVAEFRPGYSGSANLEEYYRNGDYVPGSVTGRTDIQTIFGSGTRANNPNPSATLPEIYEFSLDEDFTTRPLAVDVSESYTSLVSQDQVGSTGVFVTGGTRVTSSGGGFGPGGAGTGGVNAAVTSGTPQSLAISSSTSNGMTTFSWASAGTINFTVDASSSGFGIVAWIGQDSTSSGLTISAVNNLGGNVGNGSGSFTQSGYTFQRRFGVGSGNSPGGAGSIDTTWTITGNVTGAGSILVFATGGSVTASLGSNSSQIPTFNISLTNSNTYSVVLNDNTTGVGTGTTRTLGPSEAFTAQTNGVSSSVTIEADSTFIGAQDLFSSGTTRGVTATTASLSSRFNPVTLTGSGQSVSAVNIPAGQVDFTISATPRSDGNLNLLFSTASYDASGLTVTTSDSSVPFRVGGGTPTQPGAAGSSGWFGQIGVGTTFTVRFVGTVATARTWDGFQGNAGGSPSHANGNISVTNNALSQTVAAGNNDLSTVASERSLGSASAGGGSFSGGVDNAARADAWYVRFGATTSPADYEITGVTVTNDRTGQSAAVGIGNSNYYQGPAWLNNDGTTPTNVVGNLIPNLSAFPGGIQAGDTFTVNQCSGFRCGSATVSAGQRTRSVTTVTTQFSVTATNSNPYAIVLNDSSTGGGGTVPANGSLLLTNTATADG